MIILVDGMEKELSAIDMNGVECTEDLLGNCDVEANEDGIYVMTESEFNWWHPVVEMYNENEEMLKYWDSTAEDREKYRQFLAEYSGCEFDDLEERRNEYLKGATK